MRPSSAKVICFAAAPGTLTTLSSMVKFGRLGFEIEGGQLRIFSRSLVAAPWIAPMS